jgi:hypothetical protein
VNTATYLNLCRLHARHGPREFGKICQKFVALAFRQGGCNHVVERSVQGVDVDAAWGEKKYTIEIKTTTKRHVLYQRKDANALALREQDGYCPVLGVLPLRALAVWYLVDAHRIQPGAHEINSLRPFRCDKLESCLKSHFDGIVADHFEGAWAGAQAYLGQVLGRCGIIAEAPMPW